MKTRLLVYSILAVLLASVGGLYLWNRQAEAKRLAWEDYLEARSEKDHAQHLRQREYHDARMRLLLEESERIDAEFERIKAESARAEKGR